MLNEEHLLCHVTKHLCYLTHHWTNYVLLQTWLWTSHQTSVNMSGLNNYTQQKNIQIHSGIIVNYEWVHEQILFHIAYMLSSPRICVWEFKCNTALLCLHVCIVGFKVRVEDDTQSSEKLHGKWSEAEITLLTLDQHHTFQTWKGHTI